MTVVHAWTDGACSGNPGPGGWGVVLRAEVNGDLRTKELSGGKAHTTNNEMELAAVEEALKALKHEGITLVVHTDSQGVIGWLTGSWRCKAPHLRAIVGRITARRDRHGHELEFVKVKGHAGDPLNERADALAVTARNLAGR